MTASAMNDLIRASLGYAPAPAPDVERPVGHLGIGLGGAASQPKPAVTNALVNERIRAGARLVRDAQLRGGVTLGDLGPDDLWRS